MLELRACAEGMVQGVGLRATVRKHADTHELKGFVRNLPDGRVEFVLQGPKEKIETFLQTLQGDPGLARIDNIGLEWGKPEKLFPSFEIIN